ncbi:hypothetical protein E2C01_002435 [Portunus trituberculatus]|uniref:Uncharacterized protein n=1 Tax=Portunus trituberculatus TaxID=210409 RepID=A0A5B7CJN8_PORTR|nr:hypothetical protein [Portunus trituberculatus]
MCLSIELSTEKEEEEEKKHRERWQGLTIMRGGLSPRGRYYRHRRRYLRAQSPHTSIYSAPPALHHWHRNRFLSVQRE